MWSTHRKGTTMFNEDELHPEGINDELDEYCDYTVEPFAVSVDKLLKEVRDETG